MPREAGALPSGAKDGWNETGDSGDSGDSAVGGSSGGDGSSGDSGSPGVAGGSGGSGGSAGSGDSAGNGGSAGSGVVVCTSLDDAARRVGAFAELVVAPGDALDDVVALQAVELLRASLVELRLSWRPRGDVQPTGTVVRLAPGLAPSRPEMPKLLLQLGPGLAMSPGGIAATAHAFVGLRWRAKRVLGLDAWSFVPVTHALLQDGQNSADVWPWLFGADVSAWLVEPNSDWQLSAAGGIAIAHLAIDGHAQPPLASRADPLTIALPFARFSCARRFGPRFGIELDGFIGLASPRPVIQFAGREVADWGRPLVFSTLAFEVGLD